MKLISLISNIENETSSVKSAPKNPHTTGPRDSTNSVSSTASTTTTTTTKKSSAVTLRKKSAIALKENSTPVVSSNSNTSLNGTVSSSSVSRPHNENTPTSKLSKPKVQSTTINNTPSLSAAVKSTHSKKSSNTISNNKENQHQTIPTDPSMPKNIALNKIYKSRDGLGAVSSNTSIMSEVSNISKTSSISSSIPRHNANSIGMTPPQNNQLQSRQFGSLNQKQLAQSAQNKPVSHQQINPADNSHFSNKTTLSAPNQNIPQSRLQQQQQQQHLQASASTKNNLLQMSQNMTPTSSNRQLGSIFIRALYL
jgi:hypothetical protein